MEAKVKSKGTEERRRNKEVIRNENRTKGKRKTKGEEGAEEKGKKHEQQKDKLNVAGSV